MSASANIKLAIDRSGERRILEPPPKPSSQLKPVEPSAAFTNASKNRWRCAASSRTQPCIVASVRSVRRISRAFKRNSAKENRKTKTMKWRGRAVPALTAPQRTRKRWGAHKRKGRLRCHKRPKFREETPKEGSDSLSGATAHPKLDDRDQRPAQKDTGIQIRPEGRLEESEGRVCASSIA